MGFSKHLRDALRQSIFTAPVYGNEMNNPSGRTTGNGTDPGTPPYTNKVDDAYNTGYNFDRDMGEMAQYSSFSVTACIMGVLSPSFRNRITDAEYNELKNFMTDTENHKCELRIIVQNQRRTRRYNRNQSSVQYPSGQNSVLHTPWDLSDVASILGYRGANNVNYYNDMATGPTTAGGTTPGYVYRLPDEIRINNLNNQSGHHPTTTTDNHTHPIISGHFSAGGYASILEPGNTSFANTNGHKENITQYTATYPAFAPNITGCFATAGYHYSVNLNFTKLGTNNGLNAELDLFPCSSSSCFYDNSGFNTWATKAPTLDLKHAENGDDGGMACYEYKKSVVGSDLNYNGGFNIVLYFPIVFQAIKTLRRRYYTTYNTYIPDSFNYTVGLVFYTEVQGSSGHSHGKVYDIIFDRLRVIDRYDVESFISGGDGGNFQNHIRPNTIIIRGSNWSNGYATFSNVPLDGMTKTFYDLNRPLLSDYGLTNGNNVKIPAREFVNFHSGICYLRSGGGVLGQTFLRNQPQSFYVGTNNDISASYTPGNGTLTIYTTANNMQSNTAPLFIFTE